MRRSSSVVVAAIGLAVGIGAAGLVDAADTRADAQAVFEVTPQQLKINQRISQAAVRRSNSALQLLAPVRTGIGSGWGTSAIADDAVTSAKLSPALRAQLAASPPGVTIDGIPAGGALAGTYPGPALAAGAVGADQLAPPLAANLSGPSVQVPDTTIVTATLQAPEATPSIVDFDSGGFFQPGDPQGLTFPRSGLYRVSAAVNVGSGGGAGQRALSFALVRGTTLIAAQGLDAKLPATGSPGVILGGGIVVPALAGDRMRFRVQQFSGSTVSVNVLSAEAQYLGPTPG